MPLLIIDDFGMRKLLHTAAEDLLEIIMRRYERFSTLLTSNRPVEDWGKWRRTFLALNSLRRFSNVDRLPTPISDQVHGFTSDYLCGVLRLLGRRMH